MLKLNLISVSVQNLRKKVGGVPSCLTKPISFLLQRPLYLLSSVGAGAFHSLCQASAKLILGQVSRYPITAHPFENPSRVSS